MPGSLVVTQILAKMKGALFSEADEYSPVYDPALDIIKKRVVVPVIPSDDVLEWVFCDDCASPELTVKEESVPPTPIRTMKTQVSKASSEKNMDSSIDLSPRSGPLQTPGAFSRVNSFVRSPRPPVADVILEESSSDNSSRPSINEGLLSKPIPSNQLQSIKAKVMVKQQLSNKDLVAAPLSEISSPTKVMLAPIAPKDQIKSNENVNVAKTSVVKKRRKKDPKQDSESLDIQKDQIELRRLKKREELLRKESRNLERVVLEKQKKQMEKREKQEKLDNERYALELQQEELENNSIAQIEESRALLFGTGCSIAERQQRGIQLAKLKYKRGNALGDVDKISEDVRVMFTTVLLLCVVFSSIVYFFMSLYSPCYRIWLPNQCL